MLLSAVFPWCIFIWGATAATIRRAAPCNGNVELCSRQWSNVSQVGTHDSAFVGLLPTDNEELSVADQLAFGFRFLQAQTHAKGSVIELCHTTCLEKDAGPLSTYLGTIKTFLDRNPNEVVTLLLTNGDSLSIDQYGAVMEQSGLASYAYTPPGQLTIDQWPTLQELINANTRLVMFIDHNADTSVVPYILDEFSYFFETAFDVTTPDFPSCALDRPSGSSGDGLMYIVNHFLDVDIFGILIPDDLEDYRTNAATGTGSIGAQADVCISTWNRNPNFILLDYANRGQAIQAQNTLNGL